jgi:hypothetical protein
MMKESAEGMTIGNSGPPDGLGRFTSKSRFALERSQKEEVNTREESGNFRFFQNVFTICRHSDWTQ